MSRRVARVNNVIRQEICDLLQRQVKDPRLGNFITVTGVSTSADFKYAKIFVSHIGSPEERAATLSGLGKAAGFLRNELAKRLELRRVPELKFEWDDSIERGDRLLSIMDEIAGGKASDRRGE